MSRPSIVGRIVAVLLAVPIAACLGVAIVACMAESGIYQDGLNKYFGDHAPGFLASVCIGAVGLLLLGLANYLWTGKTRGQRQIRS
jgi:hypothetical protein